MKITVIGWYGTETIGDRAILLGLFSFFSEVYKSFEVKLGSLHPFFSERTVAEDRDFYKEIVGQDVKINIFDSTSINELTRAIKVSDLVVMGGGPLMDLDTLYIIEYAFKKAKKLNKRTALLGCGVGPLFQQKYRKSVVEIAQNSDVIILRDQSSLKSLESIYQEFGLGFPANNIDVSLDPAVECLLKYNELNPRHEQNYIAINLRQFPQEYVSTQEKHSVDDHLISFISHIASQYKDLDVNLIPMHYFHIGGDDRVFLNKVAMSVKNDNLYVQNRPLNLKDTIAVFQNSIFTVGMRFHSVVFQTLVNGRNFILDYTEPQKGKISSFISDVDTDHFYKERYVALQTEKIHDSFVKDVKQSFEFEPSLLKKIMNVYLERLGNLIK